MKNDSHNGQSVKNNRTVEGGIEDRIRRLDGKNHERANEESEVIPGSIQYHIERLDRERASHEPSRPLWPDLD